MKETIFIKTAAGQQEIQDRKLRLHPRLRSLLVLIDGRHRAGELIETLAAIGVGEASLDELERLGLIAPVPAYDATAEDDAPPTEIWLQAEDAPDEAEPDEAMSEVDRMRQLYTYFNDAIRSHLGLRGFMLQLQVEKAESFADYREIRESFLSALGKARGSDIARRQRRLIDALLEEPG